jgi:hypothetical protein
VAGKGVKDACSEWKKQQTQGVLKGVSGCVTGKVDCLQKRRWVVDET